MPEADPVSPVTGRGARRRSARSSAVWLGALVLALPASALLGASAGVAAESSVADAERTWHASVIVSGAVGVRVIHSWARGPWLRAQTLISGHPVTTLVTADRYRVWDVLSGRGLSVGRSDRARAQDAERGRPFAREREEILAAGGEKVEDTRFAGIDVSVWRVTNEAGRRTVWIRRAEPSVPVHAETFDRASGQTVRFDYTGWRVDLEIPDDFLEPPAGIEWQEFDHEDYLEAAAKGNVPPLPILYPDLLHGVQSR